MTKALRAARTIPSVRSLSRLLSSTQILGTTSLLPLPYLIPFPPRSNVSVRNVISQQRANHTQDGTLQRQNHAPARPREAALPTTCPGCGALTQWVDPQEAGFYSISRKPVKAYITRSLGATAQATDRDKHQGDQEAASARSSHDQSSNEPAYDGPSGICRPRCGGRGNAADGTLAEPTPEHLTASPICDRCHNLTHHNQGISIRHPSVESIRQTILESPFDHNHVYHVLDAADFPLSLVPGVFRELSLAPQRSKNRRSKTNSSRHSQKTTISFIITRSDLLAPQKEQVDSLMPYLVDVLRDALGPYAQDIRLGNVHCVSARRGWWTKQMKEEIWKRGGANWMVGKVNVGKSNLFEVVFPKGRNETVSYGKLQRDADGILPESDNSALEALPSAENDQYGAPSDPQIEPNIASASEDAMVLLDESTLLPPVQPETAFPVMPIISSLPGTTASPIRLSFGNGKGELIDLPGLARGDLEAFVQKEHRLDLVMTSRIKPEQVTIKPGQSLLLGGLIRITPLDPMDVFLAYSFTPIPPHVTSTEKAVGLQSQERESNVKTITEDGIGDQMLTAGIFELKWDVTKRRSGPLTASDAVGLRADRLPFKIMSTDILIEGCGWVELTAQVRKSIFRREDGGDSRDLNAFDHYAPRVEVVSPEGKHVGQRKPMNAWLFTASKPGAKSNGRGRPKKSMAGAKKNAKMVNRVMQSGTA